MKILLVDDNEDAVRWLALALERKHDCQVAYTSKPRAAVDLAIAFQPDAVCLDIGMPDIDGYSLAKLLRETPEVAGCKLVATTGYTADRERLERAGFDLHLQKPVSSKGLLDALREPALGMG